MQCNRIVGVMPWSWKNTVATPPRIGTVVPPQTSRTTTHAQNTNVCRQTHAQTRRRHQQVTERQQEQINDTTKTHQHDTQQEHSKRQHTRQGPPTFIAQLVQVVSQRIEETHARQGQEPCQIREKEQEHITAHRNANSNGQLQGLYLHQPSQLCLCAASRPARTARAPHPRRVSSDPCRIAGSATSWRQQRRQQQRHQPSSRGGKHSKSPPETKSADARPTPG